MGWCLHTWHTCLSQLWRVDDTFNLLTVDASLSQEPGLCSSHATLRSLVLLCGTVYQRTFALRLFLSGLLPGDWKHIVWTAVSATEDSLFCAILLLLLYRLWMACVCWCGQWIIRGYCCWPVADSIEANIESASVNVVRGSEHLRQARSHQVTLDMFMIIITFSCLLCYCFLLFSSSFLCSLHTVANKGMYINMSKLLTRSSS